MNYSPQAGKRAHRSGPSRGAARSAWYREATTRRLPQPVIGPEYTAFQAHAEKEIEGKRKALVLALGRDQRVGRNGELLYRHFETYSTRLAWHLRTHHGHEPESPKSGWKMDAIHEQLHGREA